MANNNHFNLTLDTLAPVGSVDIPSGCDATSANFDLNINKGDASFMFVWFDDSATTSVIPEGVEPVAAATSYETKFTSEGAFYYHVVLMDDVNNKSEVYTTDLITFDTTEPTIDTISINGGAEITKERQNTLNLTFSDEGTAPTGVVEVVIEGNIVGGPVHVPTSGTGTDIVFTFTPDAEDGPQELTVIVYDAAGNASDPEKVSITLDTTAATAVLTLKNADASANLPAYINFVNIAASIAVDSDDVVGYKIWGDLVGRGSEPNDFAPVTAGTNPIVISGLELPTGDVVKNVKIRIKDVAGNIWPEADVDPATITGAHASVTLDQTDPEVSIESDVDVISEVSGHDVATLTMSGTDSLSGVASYRLYAGETKIDEGTAVPETFELTSSDSLVEGPNTITLEVTDVAGNTATDEVIVRLDTTAPTVSIHELEEWYNARFNITVTSGDGSGSGVAEFKAWVSSVAADTNVPAGAQAVTYSAAEQTITVGDIYWTGLAQSAANYMHVQAIDNVGNVAYAHEQFGYDDVAPGNGTIAFTADAYPSVTASVNITFEDATSGVEKMRILGDIQNPTAADGWEDVSASRSVILTTGDGIKNISVIFKDTAGNISTTPATDTCELDTTMPAATLVLYDKNDAAILPAEVNDPQFDAHVSGTDDTSVGQAVAYFMYGNFNYNAQGSGIVRPESDADIPWIALEYDAGKQYKLVEKMFCTDGDGKKEVYLIVKDNAGNISQPAKVEFIYDTTPPEVAVSEIDYNRISKIHELRREAAGEIAGKYADQTNFKFTPDSEIKAFKVCAYYDQAAAIAGSYEDDAIPMTNGSINMEGNGVDKPADVAIDAMIKGADFEYALHTDGKPVGNVEDHSKDGAHIVVVYVQDMAGTWSVAAEFAI